MVLESLFHNEEGGVVGSEDRRISSQNGCNGRVSLEFLVKKLSDQWPVPSFRVIETCIKGKIPLIKTPRFHLIDFRPVGWHIENGKI